MVLNARNEKVGELRFFNGDIYYFTERDMKRSQIFSKKNYFSGKLIEHGIAIDVAILRKLFANNIKGIIYLIKNVEGHSFYGKIDLLSFMEKSVEICYDKYEITGKNKTKYGKQRIISMNDLERVKI